MNPAQLNKAHAHAGKVAFNAQKRWLKLFRVMSTCTAKRGATSRTRFLLVVVWSRLDISCPSIHLFISSVCLFCVRVQLFSGPARVKLLGLSFLRAA